MEVGSLVLIAVTFFLALIISWALVVPFFQTPAELSGLAEGDQALHDALERKERIFQSLEELEQEFMSEKLSPEAYERSKAELREEAIRCLALLDRLQGVALEAPTEAAAPSAEAPRRATA